jgi:hypothetical protein
MYIRFYIDPATDLPHFYDHGVTEEEVEWVLAHASEDGATGKGRRQSIGQTPAGRYLRVIYVPEEDDSVFVITAFPLAGKPLKAFRRRQRRRRR